MSSCKSGSDRPQRRQIGIALGACRELNERFVLLRSASCGTIFSSFGGRSRHHCRCCGDVSARPAAPGNLSSPVSLPCCLCPVSAVHWRLPTAQHAPAAALLPERLASACTSAAILRKTDAFACGAAALLLKTNASACTAAAILLKTDAFACTAAAILLKNDAFAGGTAAFLREVLGLPPPALPAGPTNPTNPAFAPSCSSCSCSCSCCCSGRLLSTRCCAPASSWAATKRDGMEAERQV